MEELLMRMASKNLPKLPVSLKLLRLSLMASGMFHLQAILDTPRGDKTLSQKRRRLSGSVLLEVMKNEIPVGTLDLNR